MTSQWTPQRLESPETPMFVQPYVQASIKNRSSASLALCDGNPPVTGRFLSPQRPSNAENVFMSLRHHGCIHTFGWTNHGRMIYIWLDESWVYYIHLAGRIMGVLHTLGWTNHGCITYIWLDQSWVYYIHLAGRICEDLDDVGCHGLFIHFTNKHSG